MDQALPSQSSASDLLEPHSEELQLRVDSFRKLGYSSAEVKAALRKLGLSTDTNSVLGELVRSRTVAAPYVSSSDSDERSTGQKDPLLPPSWTLGPCRIMPQLRDQKNTNTELRPIVIDGSNVSMSHGNKEVFSCQGIQLAVNFFLDRGHNTITVFVPTWRKEQPRPDAPITDQHILIELEKRKIVVFTPSRRVGGKRVVCYDDRFIVKLAYESDGVIVSNDTYRDLQGERPEWKKCIEERLLMFSFVNDKFMPPDDPLGRHGPSLDNFLRKKPLPTEQKRQLCPYDKKCTYGLKCKFYHPERSNQSYLSLADELREKAQISTVKEERNARLSPRQFQSDPGPSHNAFSYPQDSNTEHIRDQQNSSYHSQVCENTLLYWEDPQKSPNQMPCPLTGGQCQKEPGLHSMPSHYYANISHEYLDSGLGSYESQFSDFSHYLSNSHRLRPQQQGALPGPRLAPVHLEEKNTSQSCRCCSHVVPSTAHLQHNGNPDSKGQPKYDTYPPHMFPPGVPHQNSLPSHLHYSGAPHHQQKYWSDPFQGLPQARTSCNVPSLVHSSHSHNCSYKGHQYHSWGQQQSSSAAFDPRRLELRKKLQAIFNPHQVDTVMEMFPHVMNAEKLAAEILNLKAQRGIF
ncbi:endoribonuclease ZC3H12A [Sander lucioperca]|uniref:Zinc finger CCCH-type containing 12A n=1 Tax=Sander lucioperca TaxID=283035 RepID=A0A8D0AMQ1_SANLU|nr:endoribonuclease ZC3H12A [Sander lucioperca]